MANGSQLLPTNGEVQNVVEKIVVGGAHGIGDAGDSSKAWRVARS